MRRSLAVALAVLACTAVLAPAVFAQPPAAPAPTPKVTITGLIDQVSSWSKNYSPHDLNYGGGGAGETEWYARTRARPDITAELGTTRMVIGLEIDYTWGQTGSADTAALGGAPQRFGTTSAADLNTDMLGNIELKWAYTEFGIPLIPWASRIRLGAQPFQVMYKPAVLAHGDFGGVHWTTRFTPAIAFNLTYAQIEEAATGVRDGFIRGDDYAVIASVDITPFKGLDLKPLFAYAYFEGITNGAARQPRGGVATGNAAFAAPAAIGVGQPGGAFTQPGTGVPGTTEKRYTVGLDARWTMGPFTFDPTVLYQFGERESICTPPFCGAPVKQIADRSAWLVDLRGGWRSGPLLLEAAAIYTTGNSASEDLRSGRRQLNYFEPINTDTSYYAGWAEIWALGIDYFNIMYAAATGLNPGVAIGFDKYGLVRFGARASYALTPAFTIRAAATANWTAERVDSSSVATAGAGLIPGDLKGNQKYLGTEIDAGFAWRFAPGVTLDVVGGYLFAGPALSFAQAQNAQTLVVQPNARDAEDVITVATRLRYQF